MSDIILFHFENHEIRYVGDGINHEWVAQDVCNALGVPHDYSCRLLEFKQALGFSEILTLCYEFPRFKLAQALMDFVIKTSPLEYWKCFFAPQWDMFITAYMAENERFSHEEYQQELFANRYISGKGYSYPFALLGKKEWPKIDCHPDFLFRRKGELVPGEMKTSTFTAANLRQLSRYKESLGSSLGVIVAPSLRDCLSLSSEDFIFIEYKPISWEKHFWSEAVSS